MGEGGVDELNAMKVADLRALLARKGLPTAGKKVRCFFYFCFGGSSWLRRQRCAVAIMRRRVRLCHLRFQAELVERLLEAEGPAAASAVSPSEGGVSSAATVEDAQGTGAAAGSSGAAGGVRGNASLAGTVSRATSPALSGRAGGCVASLSGKTNAGGGLQQQQSSANKASGSAGACSKCLLGEGVVSPVSGVSFRALSGVSWLVEVTATLLRRRACQKRLSPFALRPLSAGPLEMSEEERLAARKCRFGECAACEEMS